MNESIVEVFGKFAVELGDGPELFETVEEAQLALSQYENIEEHQSLADGYCAYKGLTGKGAKTKSNTIVDFLNWVAADRPEAQEAEATADEVPEESSSEDMNEIIF